MDQTIHIYCVDADSAKSSHIPIYSPSPKSTKMQLEDHIWQQNNEMAIATQSVQQTQ
ncbi:uncharacterized protein LDX57_003209 [Aspergillus melleus]|uniref:uncharacterized protein n=1 Tax=Aspergillus melleus TaxID=138277 RepID=UPI001E8D89CD|nr:uncharacterized protein LDX57_003209 [Aspergillus melleus]KAH8425456.1 hypothetical protein LDX57_003209 [Aspergillus melleus]